MRSLTIIAFVFVTGCTDVTVINNTDPSENSEVAADTGSGDTATEDTDVLDTGADTDTEETGEEVVPPPAPCPIYEVREQATWRMTEVSDELVVTTGAYTASYEANGNRPIMPNFQMKSLAPEGCGGLTVTGVDQDIQVMGEYEEMRALGAEILNPVDENGNLVWIGSDLYEQTWDNGYEWLDVESGEEYSVGTWENGSVTRLYVTAHFTEFTDFDGDANGIAFTGGEDWRRFAINTFLADFLPPDTLMTLYITVRYEVDGMAMAPVGITVPFYLYEI